jgi:PAS domain S-box-containing protein
MRNSLRNTLLKIVGVGAAYGLAVLVLSFLQDPKNPASNNSIYITVFLLSLPVVLTALAFNGTIAVLGVVISLAISVIYFPGITVLDNSQHILFAILIYGGLASAITLLKYWRNPAPPRYNDQTTIHSRSHSLMKRSLNFVQIIDKEGNILQTNDRAIEILGQPNRIWEFFHPDDQSRIRDELSEAFVRGEIGPLKLRVISTKHQTIPVELKIVRLEATKREQRLALEMRDISAIADLENKAREAQARYRYLIEDAIDTLDTGVLLLDRDKKVIWANKTLENFFSLDRDEMIGNDVKRAIASAKTMFCTPENFEKAVHGSQEPFIFNIKCGANGSNTERILEYRSLPVSTERYRGGRIDHYFDITEKKRLELRLQEKTLRLEDSNKKLEEFTHVVSHDLKEPLRTIEAFSRFILEDYAEKLDAEGQEYLNRITKASARMKNLIDDLLKLSRIGTKQEPLEKVDIHEILEEVREVMSSRLQSEHVLLELKNSYPIVMASRTRLIELFSNLVSNAIKYNDKLEKRIEVGYRDSAEFYEFYVKDNGMGIESQYLERIFELFERLNPLDDNEGTGAGLAICKRIVEEFGGEIWAESTLGEGSSFLFTLPKKPAARQPLAEAPSAPEITTPMTHSSEKSQNGENSNGNTNGNGRYANNTSNNGHTPNNVKDKKIASVPQAIGTVSNEDD